MTMKSQNLLTSKDGLRAVQYLATEGYIPFAEIERAIRWPGNALRFENDAEHSHSLAFVGAALGTELGLDAAKIALYATYHDFPERYAGDTSVWDKEGRTTKAEREEQAIERIEELFKHTPSLAITIRAYEAKEDEEARFVYALDKMFATLLIVEGKGAAWKKLGITYEQHLEKVAEERPKVAVHPTVLVWYEALLTEISVRKDELFALSSK